MPNILVPGLRRPAYVFAEFGYQLHRAGHNVFIMPKHGGRTVQQLLARHQDALRFISTTFNDTIGVYGEGPVVNVVSNKMQNVQPDLVQDDIFRGVGLARTQQFWLDQN